MIGNALTEVPDDWASMVYSTTDPAAWADAPPPEQEWMVRGWLPKDRAAYLTGSGGAGKSLLTQQLATCVSLGAPFMGLETTHAVAVYVTAEDDENELRRRQRAICNALGVTERELGGRLRLLSLFGLPDNVMVDFTADGTLRKLASFILQENTYRDLGASFVVLDNVSHLFGGNEINRAQVTGFANALNRLASDIAGTVLLVGHPNKQGDHYSGSTAWENAFRARLFFDAPKGDQVHADPDARELSLPKANYSAKGSRVAVRWHHGAFVREDDLPPSVIEELREVSGHTAANSAFLRCLDVATKQRRAVSHVPGVNYAPKVFAGMTEGRGHTHEAFAGAMERLVHLGEIAFDQRLWKGENYHWKTGIQRGEDNPPTPADPPAEMAENRPLTPAANPPLTPSANPQKTVRQPPSADPLYTTYIKGGAPWAPPPDEDLDWSIDGEGGEQ